MAFIHLAFCTVHSYWCICHISHGNVAQDLSVLPLQMSNYQSFEAKVFTPGIIRYQCVCTCACVYIERFTNFPEI